jgi:FKBP-type peptidyl-prolyl cis-trans isomerase FkpA
MTQPQGFSPFTTSAARWIVLLPTLLLAAACGGDGASSSTAPATSAGAPAAVPAAADVAALGIEDPVAGTGAEARSGMMVSVHYTGWLYNPAAANKRGNKFDSSKDRGQPFEFQLGQRDVIAGWDEGVKGMKVGGTRILTIPSAMGYGARGAGGDIPPNSALVFEVELLGVK